VQTRVLKAEFGDGYGQRVADGLNPIRYTYNLSWDNLEDTDADTIEDFLIERGGYKAFYWTPPRSAVALKWVCETWTRVHTTAVLDTVQATFVQVFDIGE
jgi:phage-related protein